MAIKVRFLRLKLLISVKRSRICNFCSIIMCLLYALKCYVYLALVGFWNWHWLTENLGHREDSNLWPLAYPANAFTTSPLWPCNAWNLWTMRCTRRGLIPCDHTRHLKPSIFSSSQLRWSPYDVWDVSELCPHISTALPLMWSIIDLA